MTSFEEYKDIFLNRVNHFIYNTPDNSTKFYKICVIPSYHIEWYNMNIKDLIFSGKNLYEVWVKLNNYLLFHDSFNMILEDYEYLLDEINYYYQTDEMDDFIDMHINGLDDQTNIMGWYFKEVTII